MSLLRDLVVLVKLRIVLVAVFTGAAGIVVAGVPLRDPIVAWALLGMLLMGAGANALNQVFEWRRDARMARTRVRRPVAAGRLGPATAVLFATGLILGSQAAFLGGCRSPLAAQLALATVGYYSFLYTLWLKPRWALSTVVGGVPGAMGPVLGWAAVAGEVTVAALAMALVIFLWTPPHVWALAIRLKEDYARAGIPMLPVVKGDDETTRQIFLYSLALVAFTLVLPFLPAFSPPWERSPVFSSLALVLGLVLLVWTWLLWRRRPLLPTMPLFRFSIAYIACLFLGLGVDALGFRGGR